MRIVLSNDAVAIYLSLGENVADVILCSCPFNAANLSRVFPSYIVAFLHLIRGCSII